MAKQNSYATQGRIIADTDWKDRESVGDCAIALWDARGCKADLEERTYRNEQFLWGNHWYWWDDAQQAMVPRQDVEGWRARLVFNDILTTVTQRAAKMMRSMPAWNYMAQTDEEYDRIVQRRNQQVMEWTWNEGVKMPAKLRRALQWAMSSPVVFGRPFWNRNKGPKVEVSLDAFRAQGMIVQDPLQRQNIIREADNKFWQMFGPDAYQQGRASFHSGEPDVAVHPIFEVMWWPFYPKEWTDVRKWMISVKKTVAEVADEFELDKDEVRRMATPNQQRGVSASGVSKWGDKYFWTKDDEAFYDDDCVLVHTLYEQPCKSYPNGQMAVVIGQGGEVVFGPTEINNPLKRSPIVPLVEIDIRGNAHGTCVVDQMIDPQEDMNHKLSMVADYLNKKIMPTLVNFVGNESSNQQALSNAPGKIYKASGPDKIPVAIKMPDIGADYFNMANIDRVWMQNIGGIASIDEGRTDDASVRSGRAILALREQNDLRLIPFGEALNEWVQEIGNFIIALWWENAHTERMIQLVGEGNELEVLAFRNTDIRPKGYGTPGFNNAVIRTTAFSNIPRSPQEVLNFLTVLGNNGLIMPEDRNAIVEMMGYGEFRKLTDKERKDQTRQWYEIEQWKKGQIVGPPDDSDLDRVHIEIIDKWKATEEFRQLEKAAQVDMRAAMLVNDVNTHRETHQKWQARKLSEAAYLMLDGDLTMWMKHRGAWMQQFAQMAAMGDGQIDPLAFQVVNQLYALPLGLVTGQIGAPPAAQASSGQQGGKPAENQPKGRNPNGTSPNQGVSKNENVSKQPASAP